MTTTLVVGAHGTVGTELVRHLAERGHTVRRATSRPPTAADQVGLDLVTQRGAKEAFRGVDRAFLLSPPGHVNQHELLVPTIDAARATGVEKIVLMSAMGANADPNTPLRKAELHLEQSGLSWNVIRPNWFMQNFNTFWIRGILDHGKILLPVGTAKGSFIDARDIAAVAAQLLVQGGFDNRDFDLTGPRALDHDEAAAILSRETGRRIVFEDVSPEAMRPALLGAGLPEAYADHLLLILGYFKAGYAQATTDAVRTITGREPLGFERYAKDYRAAWS